LNVATIWPFELRKFEPAISTACPAVALDGVRAEMTGGPPGEAGAVFGVVVVTSDEGDGRAGEPLPGPVAWWAGPTAAP